MTLKITENNTLALTDIELARLQTLVDAGDRCGHNEVLKLVRKQTVSFKRSRAKGHFQAKFTNE